MGSIFFPEPESEMDQECVGAQETGEEKRTFLLNCRCMTTLKIPRQVHHRARRHISRAMAFFLAPHTERKCSTSICRCDSDAEVR